MMIKYSCYGFPLMFYYYQLMDGQGPKGWTNAVAIVKIISYRDAIDASKTYFSYKAILFFSLVACKRLFKPLSVGRSVGRSVGPSICPSVSL